MEPQAGAFAGGKRRRSAVRAAQLVRAMRRDRALRYRYLLGTLEARRRLLADALPHLGAPLLDLSR